MQEVQDAKAVQEQNAEHAKVRKPLTPRLQYAHDEFDTIDEFGAPSGRLALRASRHTQRRLRPAKRKEVRNHLENPRIFWVVARLLCTNINSSARVCMLFSLIGQEEHRKVEEEVGQCEEERQEEEEDGSSKYELENLQRVQELEIID